MSASIEVKFDGTAFERFVNSMSEKYPAEIRRRLLLAAEAATGHIRTVVYERTKEGTGRLARSFRPSFLEDTGDELSAIAGSSLVYAQIQDEGGTIRPKTRRMLAVPLPGVPRGRWPRAWPHGQLIRIGKVLGTLKSPGKGKHGPSQFVPKYVLVPRVRIRPKQYLEEAAKRSAPEVEAIIHHGIEALADEAAR